MRTPVRIRKTSSELVFTMTEFRALSVAELCRRYGWGDDGEWLDRVRDESAEREAERGLAVQV